MKKSKFPGVRKRADFASLRDIGAAYSGMTDAEVSAVLLDDANDLAPVPVERAGDMLVLHKKGCDSAAFLLSFRH